MCSHNSQSFKDKEEPVTNATDETEEDYTHDGAEWQLQVIPHPWPQLSQLFEVIDCKTWSW